MSGINRLKKAEDQKRGALQDRQPENTLGKVSGSNVKSEGPGYSKKMKGQKGSGSMKY